MTSCCWDSPRSSYWYILSFICVNVPRASSLTDVTWENNILFRFILEGVTEPVSLLTLSEEDFRDLLSHGSSLTTPDRGVTVSSVMTSSSTSIAAGEERPI